jgi:hypothetical protein
MMCIIITYIYIYIDIYMYIYLYVLGIEADFIEGKDEKEKEGNV